MIQPQTTASYSASQRQETREWPKEGYAAGSWMSSFPSRLQAAALGIRRGGGAGREYGVQIDPVT